jgi:hypothetical protein
VHTPFPNWNLEGLRWSCLKQGLLHLMLLPTFLNYYKTENLNFSLHLFIIGNLDSLIFFIFIFLLEIKKKIIIQFIKHQSEYLVL